MEYMLLIYWSEAEARNRSEAEMGRMHQDYMTFTQDLVRQGKNKGGNGLERTASASTVETATKTRFRAECECDIS